MTIEQTIEVPASRRIFLELPPDLPVGKVKITVTTEVAHPNIRTPISQYFGIISPNTYGDGVAYQRKLRDEWNA